MPIYYLMGNKDAQPKQFTSTFVIVYINKKGQTLEWLCYQGGRAGHGLDLPEIGRLTVTHLEPVAFAAGHSFWGFNHGVSHVLGSPVYDVIGAGVANRVHPRAAGDTDDIHSQIGKGSHQHSTHCASGAPHHG